MGNRITEREGLTERYETNKMHVNRVTIIFCFNRPNTCASYKFTEERGCLNTTKDVINTLELQTPAHGIFRICRIFDEIQSYYKINRHFQCCIETKFLVI